MDQWFLPMGLNLRVATNTSQLAMAVHEAYGPFGSGNHEQAPDLVFEFEHTQCASGTAAMTYHLYPALAEMRFGDEAHLSIDRDTGTATGHFSSRVLADSSSFRLHALHFALSAALSARGFLGLHASCFSIGGKSVLLRGPSGAGKTVLAY